MKGRVAEAEGGGGGGEVEGGGGGGGGGGEGGVGGGRGAGGCCPFPQQSAGTSWRTAAARLHQAGAVLARRLMRLESKHGPIG